jgi:hypothetical protein
MYAQQSQLPSATKYFLDALDTGDVQLKTPDGADTVFAQKMQQGIARAIPQVGMQGMNQVRQDVQAAMPSVARNAQEAQMRQALQLAMQPKPAGIEGLPSNIRMAEGGVVGYSGRDGSDVKLDIEQILKKAPAARTPEENAALREAGVVLDSRSMGPESGIVSQLNRALSGPFIREAITGGALNLSDEELAKRSDAGAVTERMFRGLGGNKAAMDSTTASNFAPQAMRTEDAFASPRIDQPTRPTTPPAPPMAMEAQRLTSQQGPRGIASAPPSPVQRTPVAPAQPAPTGIAAAIERPSIESAVQQARAALGQDNQYETRMRGIAEREEAMRRGLPDLNAKGIAALEEAFRQRKDDSQRAKFNALFEGWKGNTAAYGNFKAAERQAEQENKMAILKFQEAQQARQLGEFDRARALEKEVQGHKDKQDQILQNLASSAASMEGQLYGADVRSRDAALDREAQRKLEEYRRQTQLMRPKEQDMVSRLEALKLSEITGGKPETATPAQKLQALRSAIQDSRGTGVEERTDLNNLRLRAKIIQDELKEIMVESPRKQQLQRELDGIYRQLGGSPTGAPQGTVDKNNPLLK